ncbi:MAG: hypothetical protein ACK50D_01960 [Burkholderiales bacterium]
MPNEENRKSLAHRLGLTKPNETLAIALPPAVRALLPPLGKAVTPAVSSTAIVCAVQSAADIQHQAKPLAERYQLGGMLWMLYPKRSGSI